MANDLLGNDARAPDVLLIAPPQGRRARAFQDTLRALGWSPARVVSYLDLMEGRVSLPELIRGASNGGRGTVVRFDSPGEDVETEHALTLRGGGLPADPPANLAAGELAQTRAWLSGFSAVLRELDAGLQRAPPHLRMQHTEHLLTMFDKPATHARLQAAGTVFDLTPSVRFQGEPGEQWTMFFRDPSGNPIEIKGFPSLDGVFAH